MLLLLLHARLEEELVECECINLLYLLKLGQMQLVCRGPMLLLLLHIFTNNRSAAAAEG